MLTPAQLVAQYLGICVVALALCAGPAAAKEKTEPAKSGSAPAKVPSKPKKGTPKRAVAKADSGSTETVAARERRLKRECKGRPNAGACLGYSN